MDKTEEEHNYHRMDHIPIPLTGIRVDASTQLYSVIDVLRSCLGEDTSSNRASEALRRVIYGDPALEGDIVHTRPNGRGRVTPMASLVTIIRILMQMNRPCGSVLRKRAAEALAATSCSM